MHKFKLQAVEFYTLHGRIGRLKFVSGIAVILISVTILYLLGGFLGLFDFDSDVGRILASLLAIVFIVAASPFFVKRLHDLNTHGGWAVTFIVSLVFSVSNIWAAIYFYLGLLILLLKRGNPDKNEWGAPDKLV